MKGRNAPKQWSMNDFSLGWDNNSPATMLDPRCVADCKNFNLTNKKGLSKRGGMTKLYATSAGAADVEQLFEYKSPGGTDYVLIATGTKIRAYYTATTGAIATLAFVDSDPDTITDSGNGFITAGFQAGDTITVSGSTSNDGTYTIATVVAGTITLDAGDELTAEGAGGTDTITSTQWHDMKISLTTSLNYSFSVHLGSCYITNGTNANVRLYDTVSYTVGIPAATTAPTPATGDPGALTGDYYYKYTYRRDTNGHSSDGNPSTISALVQPAADKVDVGVTASADSNVNHIVLYRTLASGSIFYKVAELANSTASYEDNITDANLSTQLETNNDVPPKAKFTCVHKDRMFYANCPDETDGKYLVVWSKSGKSECVPAGVTGNWQYFDRADGEPITGIASVGDFLLVFKRNKISIIRGDLTDTSTCELYSIAMGIGCIASWAIMPFEDKVVFLSEEGWKACDGQKIFALSENINGILTDGWLTEDENANVTAIWYPEKSQMQYNINHSTLGQRVYVGHFLIPLLLVGKGVAESETGALVAWTYHQYDDHELTALGTYTDANGITQPIAGDNAGWIYVLDSGTADTGADDVANDIPCTFQTDWVDMGTGRGITKTVRRGYVDYVAAAATNLTFNIERNFSDTDDTQTITGTGGVGSAIGARVHLSGTARRFRYTITQDDNVGLDINGISMFYRLEGRR